MLDVFGPLAAQVKCLAALCAGERADDGGFLVVVVAAEFGDGVVILLVEKNDAFEDAGQRVVVLRRQSHGYEKHGFRGKIKR